MRNWRALALSLCVAMTFQVGVATAHARGGAATTPADSEAARPATTPTADQARRAWIRDHTARRTAPRERQPVSGLCDQETLADSRGDNKRFDVLSTTITSDCISWTVTTRLAKPVDLTKLGYWAWDLDTKPGRKGCDDADFWMVAYVERSRLVAYMLDVGSCDPDEWTTREALFVRQPDSRTLQVTVSGASFGALYLSSTASWRSSIDTIGTGGTDLAPNRGWRSLALPPSPPRELNVEVDGTTATVTWTAALQQNSQPKVTYTVTLSKDDAAPVTLPRPRPGGRSQRLTGLVPGSTYTVVVTAATGKLVGRPATARFVVPVVRQP